MESSTEAERRRGGGWGQWQRTARALDPSSTRPQAGKPSVSSRPAAKEAVDTKSSRWRRSAAGLPTSPAKSARPRPRSTSRGASGSFRRKTASRARSTTAGSAGWRVAGGRDPGSPVPAPPKDRRAPRASSSPHDASAPNAMQATVPRAVACSRGFGSVDEPPPRAIAGRADALPETAPCSVPYRLCPRAGTGR